MLLPLLQNVLRDVGTKTAMGDYAYAPGDGATGMEMNPGMQELPPEPPPESVWDKYKMPALVAGGALLAGYGLHHHFGGEDTAQVAEAAGKAGGKPVALDAARAAGTDAANAQMGLKLTPEDFASAQGRPAGLLNTRSPLI